MITSQRGYSSVFGETSPEYMSLLARVKIPLLGLFLFSIYPSKISPFGKNIFAVFTNPFSNCPLISI